MWKTCEYEVFTSVIYLGDASLGVLFERNTFKGNYEYSSFSKPAPSNMKLTETRQRAIPPVQEKHFTCCMWL
jgi:hypothetical protein